MSEVRRSVSPPTGSRHSKGWIVAAFVGICISSSHSHLPALRPRIHPSESTMTLQICIFAFTVSAFLLFMYSVSRAHRNRNAETHPNNCDLRNSRPYAFQRRTTGCEIHYLELGDPRTPTADSTLLLCALGLCGRLMFC